MNRFYILTFCDAVHYGLGVKDVFMFDSKELAIKKMNEMYQEKAKELDIENPYDDMSYDYEIGDDYAYFSDAYYWDIFNKDIEYEN